MSYDRPGYCNLCEVQVPVVNGICKSCIDDIAKKFSEPTQLNIRGNPFFCTAKAESRLAPGVPIRCGNDMFYVDFIKLDDGELHRVYVCTKCEAIYSPGG
jgi:hypothetical protein